MIFQRIPTSSTPKQGDGVEQGAIRIVQAIILEPTVGQLLAQGKFDVSNGRVPVRMISGFLSEQE
jgi:hypothetical protein